MNKKTPAAKVRICAAKVRMCAAKVYLCAAALTILSALACAQSAEESIRMGMSADELGALFPGNLESFVDDSEGTGAYVAYIEGPDSGVIEGFVFLVSGKYGLVMYMRSRVSDKADGGAGGFEEFRTQMERKFGTSLYDEENGFHYWVRGKHRLPPGVLEVWVGYEWDELFGLNVFMFFGEHFRAAFPEESKEFPLHDDEYARPE
jgi:hypothetical protein